MIRRVQCRMCDSKFHVNCIDTKALWEWPCQKCKRRTGLVEVLSKELEDKLNQMIGQDLLTL